MTDRTVNESQANSHARHGKLTPAQKNRNNQSSAAFPCTDRPP
jgi:hypothetical protein